MALDAADDETITPESDGRSAALALVRGMRRFPPITSHVNSAWAKIHVLAQDPCGRRLTRNGKHGRGPSMATAVTSTDRAIIRQLQRNARMSYAEVSRETGIPESTVRRRMGRLNQRGVIEFAMVADPSKLGYELRAMIGLRVELRKLTEIAARLREMNEVNFAAFLTGNFDIMIQVIVRSQENLVHFLTKRLASIEGVRSTETFVMPYVIKPMTSWVLPELEAAGSEEEDESGPDEGGRPAGIGETLARPRGRRGRQRRAAAGVTQRAGGQPV